MSYFDEIGVYSLADLDLPKSRAYLTKAKAEAEKHFSKIKAYDSPEEPDEPKQPSA
ncbi:MAG: hypothetical protein JWQ71_138 [Pedosphaera sp.]|nr:hypothetical protein [Pedosphaera sp.]